MIIRFFILTLKDFISEIEHSIDFCLKEIEIFKLRDVSKFLKKLSLSIHL